MSTLKAEPVITSIMYAPNSLESERRDVTTKMLDNTGLFLDLYSLFGVDAADLLGCLFQISNHGVSVGLHDPKHLHEKSRHDVVLSLSSIYSSSSWCSQIKD